MSIQTVTKVAFDLSDPSTYAGLGVMAAMTGHALPPTYSTYANAFAVLMGGLATFLSKKHNIVLPTTPAVPEVKE